MTVTVDLKTENIRLKARIAELEAALAQYENGEIIAYANKRYELVNRKPQAGDIVMFQHSNTGLIKKDEAYRLTFMNNKPRFVLENGMLAGLNDSVVQRSVGGMKVYAPKGDEEDGNVYTEF